MYETAPVDFNALSNMCDVIKAFKLKAAVVLLFVS